MEAPTSTYQTESPLVGDGARVASKRPLLKRLVGLGLAAACAGAVTMRSSAAPAANFMMSKGECDLTLESLQIPDSKNSSMLWAHMEVSVVSSCTTDVDVLVKYRADGTDMDYLWATMQEVQAGATGAFTLARLRAKTKYAYSIYVSQTGKSNENMYKMINGTFTSAATGVPRFDDGPLATITGTPSWQTLSFKYAATVSPASTTAAAPSTPSAPAARRLQEEPTPDEPSAADDGGDDDAGLTAEGLVAIDSDGYVVFFYRGTGIMAWDATDAATLVIAKELDGGEKEWADDDGGDRRRLETHVGSSAFVEIDAKGIMQNTLVQACSGAPLNANELTHEALYDATTGNVLGLASKYGRFPNVTVQSTSGHYKAENFVGEEVIMWNRHKGERTTVLDIFDYVTPEKDMFESGAWYAEAKKESCSGKKKIEAVEYSKLDSVSVGPSGNLIVTSKNLNAIFSFTMNPVALEWTISPSITSDYAFAKESDAFYGPQNAVQLADGGVLVFDGGYGRPGCTDTNTDGCFSRIAKYTLTAATKHADATATLGYQFEYPVDVSAANGTATTADGGHAQYAKASLHDLYNPVGGSVYELESGAFLMSFAEGLANDRKYNLEGSIVTVEVDKHGDLVSLIEMPHSDESGDLSSMGSYRVKPWSTIGGESPQAPSDKTEVVSSSNGHGK